ncbi:DedA family protein [Brevibacillus dissolubilis]|uniref:DedA family protein n=1 Tax=Brevibacillus dissolubilis TaxID=1844116 RepID=UPI0011169DFD|nr:DedA family protein [Brevibacillus dissolubilis]
MVTTIWDTIVWLVATFSYLGVFLSMVVEGIGLPFPGDVALSFFGYLASRERFDLMQTILFATLGSGVGSMISFTLGKRYGVTLLQRYGKYLLISQQSIEVTTRFSSRYGVLVLLVGRMLPGVRTLSSYVAGIGNLSWPTFLVCSFIGFFIFCGFWTMVGFYLGENWSVVVKTIKEYLVGIASGVILIGVTSLLWRKFRKK